MLTQMMDRAHGWADRHARIIVPLCVLAACVLALWLRTLHLTDTPSRSPDENLYTNVAQQIAQGGLGAYRGIFARYANDPSQWIYPSPTRLVHVLLFAGVMKVTGATSPQAGAAVSWFLGIASVLVLARLGRRFISGFVGVLAALLLATYVVELEFARRAWGESTAAFLTLLLVYATLALDQAPQSNRWRAAFFAAGTACVFSKETAIFAYGMCGLWLVARQLFVAKDRRLALWFCLGGLASVGVAFGVLVLLSGNVRYALAGWTHVFGNGLGSNEWGALYASGPWYQFLALLWVMAPITASLAAVGVAVVWRPWRGFDELEPSARACASLATLLTSSLVIACAFGPNLQYLRIMAPANPTYCLLAALGARALYLASEGLLQGKVQALLLPAYPVLLVAIGIRDYGLYRDVVVASGMHDLAVRWLLDGAEHRREPALDSTRQALAAQTPAPPPSPVAPAAPDHLGRSVELCRRGAYAECVSAAQAALKQDPHSAEAWNNAAAGFAGLQRWDEAIRHATQAIAIRGDFQLAKNNLAWAQDEKNKRLASSAR
jgi:tetratricopeptide (TPR) repeat protein